MRHCRRAFLSGGEELLRLAKLGALKMPDFGGKPFDRTCDDTKHGKEHRVAVARNDLRGYRLGRQPQLVGDMRLDGRVDMRKGADRAGNRAGGDLLARRDQPRTAAGELGKEGRQLQAKGCRLGMDAVAAADRRRVAMFLGAGAKRRQKPVHAGKQQIAGACHLYGKRGVENVGGGHALMYETGVFANMFGKAGQEGDDIMLCLALDLVDSVDIETAAFPDGLCRLLRDHAKRRHRVTGMCLNFVPDLKFTLFGPDGGHFRSRISGNHRGVFLCH